MCICIRIEIERVSPHYSKVHYYSVVLTTLEYSQVNTTQYYFSTKLYYFVLFEYFSSTSQHF